MSTITGFNDMMEQFLEELVQTFPEEPAMKKYRNAFEMLRKANSRTCMENFMHNIAPYSKQVMAKDASFFLNNPDVFKDFKLASIWTDDLSDNTKNAIWQYLQTLYILGNTISALPENTLNMIEQLAKQCAGEMNAGAIDTSALMAGMSNMFAGQLEKKS
jgi:hypothetical protein